VSSLRTVRVVIVDDDPIVRHVVRQCIGAEPGFEVVAEYADGKAAVAAIREHHPDVLLLDMLMPDMNGIEVLRDVSGSASVHVLVLCSSLSTEQTVEILELGGRGAISKRDIGQLIPAINAVISGRYWVNGAEVSNVVQVLNELSREIGPQTQPRPYQLTLREMQIVRLITDGLTNRDIGLELSITEETVKRHLTNIFEKVGMSNRLELAMFAVNHNLVRKGQGDTT
jgi:two-component system, NarL family, nitrate/nitrite response regulator NarL